MTSATKTKTKTKRTNTGEALADLDERMALGRLVGWRCPVCRRKMVVSGRDSRCVLNVDHVVPCAHGGLDVTENYGILCGSCNFSKSSLDLAEWLVGRLMKVRKLARVSTGRKHAAELLPELMAVNAATAETLNDMRRIAA